MCSVRASVPPSRAMYMCRSPPPHRTPESARPCRELIRTRDGEAALVAEHEQTVGLFDDAHARPEANDGTARRVVALSPVNMPHPEPYCRSEGPEAVRQQGLSCVKMGDEHVGLTAAAGIESCA
jgi:hypothetical protein